MSKVGVSKSRIPLKVQQLIASRAAGRCEYRGCNKLLTEDDLTKRPAKLSAFAHIVADRDSGPRGDPVLSPKLAADIGNIMLLCLDCHRRIDVEDVEGHPVDLLTDMKARHEDRVRRLTEIDDGHRTLLVLMEANIGSRKGLVRVDDARGAVLPMYPEDEVHIDLARLRTSDGASGSWAVGVAEIDAAGPRVQDALVRGDAKHLSIFALAPIPLLMYLGRVLGDIAPGEAYQRRRRPPGWAWLPQSGREPFFEERSPATVTGSLDVILVLSVSESVDMELVGTAGPVGADLYEVAVPTPQTDIIRAREQVADFRALVQRLLSRLRASHGMLAVVHVFPALPNSLAVEFGRALLPKADPRIEVYDLNSDLGGWVRALTLLPGLATQPSKPR